MCYISSLRKGLGTVSTIYKHFNKRLIFINNNSDGESSTHIQLTFGKTRLTENGDCRVKLTDIRPIRREDLSLKNHFKMYNTRIIRELSCRQSSFTEMYFDKNILNINITCALKEIIMYLIINEQGPFHKK